MPHVFISYSHHDVAAANALADLLRAAGVDTFVDYQRIDAGENFPERLAHEIERREMLILLMSQHSAASKWVQREVQYADSLNKTIVMLRLDATALPKGLFFLQYHDYIDATTWRLPAALPAPILNKLGRALDVTLAAPPISMPLPPPPSPARTAPTAPEFVIARTGVADFRSINDALANVPEGAVLRVRPGVYHEAVKLTKAVEIVGDGARHEILLEIDNGTPIYMATDYAVVRGLTIRQRADVSRELACIHIPMGRLILEDCDIISSSYACIQIVNYSSQPLVRRCYIHDSNTYGVVVYENAGGTFEDCDIFSNTLANIAIKTGGQPAMRRCRIHDGITAGVLVWENGGGTFEECDIYMNTYPGIEVKTGGQPAIRRCAIHDGKQNGVFIHQNASGTFEGCDIMGNGLSGNYAGVEIRDGGDPTLVRCTISKNSGSGVRSHADGRGTVVDCDLRGNRSRAFEIDMTSQVVRHNNKT